MPSLYCTICDQSIASVRSVIFEGSMMHQDCYLERVGRRLRTTSPSRLHPPRRAA